MAGCLGGPVTGRERGIFEMLKTTANSQLTYYVVMYTVDDVNDKRLFSLNAILKMIPVEHFRTMVVDYFERHVVVRNEAEFQRHRERGWPTPVEPIDLNNIMETIDHIMNCYRG